MAKVKLYSWQDEEEEKKKSTASSQNKPLSVSAQDTARQISTKNPNTNAQVRQQKIDAWNQQREASNNPNISARARAELKADGGDYLDDAFKSIAKGTVGGVEGITVKTPAALLEGYSSSMRKGNVPMSAEFEQAYNDYFSQHPEQEAAYQQRLADSSDYLVQSAEKLRDSEWSNALGTAQDNLTNDLTGTFAGEVLESVGQQIPAMTAAAATAGTTALANGVPFAVGAAQSLVPQQIASLGTMALSGFGNTYDQARSGEMGQQYSIDQAMRYAGANTALETATEVFSPWNKYMPGVIQNVGLDDIIGEGMEEVAGGVFEPFTMAALEETPEATSQKLKDTFLDLYGTDEGKVNLGSIGKGIVKQAPDLGKRFLSGAASAAVIGGATNVINSAGETVNSMRSDDYSNEVKFINQQMDALSLEPASEERVTRAAILQQEKQAIRDKYLTAENLQSKDSSVRLAAQRANTDFILERSKAFGIDSKLANNMATICNRVGIMMDYDGNLVDSEGASVNGYYDNGVLKINPNAKDAPAVVFSHELTHALENSEHYGAYRSALYDLADRGILDTRWQNIDELKNRISTKYAEAGQTVTPELLESETTAFLTQDLLGNEKAIQELVRGNRPAAQRVLDWVNETIAKLGNNEQELAALDNKRTLQNAKKIFEQAIDNANIQITPSTDTAIEADTEIDTGSGTVEDSGVFFTDNKNRVYHQITDQEKNYANRIGKAFGRRVVFEEMKNGRRAYYSDGTIHINSFQAETGANTFQTLVIHELIHSTENSSIYNEMRDFFINSKVGQQWLNDNGVTSLEEFGIRLQEDISAAGETIKIDPEHEALALALENTLFQEDKLQVIIAENETGFARFLTSLRNMFSRLRGRQFDSEIDQLNDYFTRALNDTRKEMKSLQNISKKSRASAMDAISYMGEGESITDVNGKTVAYTDEAGTKEFNLITYYETQWTETDENGKPLGIGQARAFQKNKSGRDILIKSLDKQVKKGEISRTDADDILAQMDRFAEMAKNYADKEETTSFANWATTRVRVDSNGKPFLSVQVKNGEYTMNLDFAKVCKKRSNLNNVLNYMVENDILKAGELQDTDYAALNQIIKNHGLEISCGLCFVDSKRYMVSQYATTFTQPWNYLISALADNKPVMQFNYIDAPNRLGGATGIKADADARARVENLLENGVRDADGNVIFSFYEDGKIKSLYRKMADLMFTHPEVRQKINPNDMVSSVGMEAFMANNPDLFTLMNGHMGVAKPKTSTTETQYRGEIGVAYQWTSDVAFLIGGVRLQSFSDYKANMFLDYVQAFSDLSRKNLPLQTYTKEAAFAKIFGKTGAKINMSILSAVDPADLQYLRGYVNKNSSAVKLRGTDASKMETLSREYTDILNKVGLDNSVSREELARLNDPNTTEEERAEIRSRMDYVWGEETFPVQEAFDLQDDDEYSKNIGTILVGVSYHHILKAMEDPKIRMVIPYHKSGLNHIIALKNNLENFTDYTNSQTEKNSKGSKLTDEEKPLFKFNYYEEMERLMNEAAVRNEDGSLTVDQNKMDFVPKQAAINLVRYCEQNGFRPRFPQFAYIINDGTTNVIYDENNQPVNVERDIHGNAIVRDGYYKTLIDYAVYDNKGHFTYFDVEQFNSKRGKATRSTRLRAQNKVSMTFPDNIKVGAELEKLDGAKLGQTISIDEYISQTLKDQQRYEDLFTSQRDAIIDDFNKYLSNKGGGTPQYSRSLDLNEYDQMEDESANALLSDEERRYDAEVDDFEKWKENEAIPEAEDPVYKEAVGDYYRNGEYIQLGLFDADEVTEGIKESDKSAVRKRAQQAKADIDLLAQNGRNLGSTSMTLEQNGDQIAGGNKEVRAAWKRLFQNPLHELKGKMVNHWLGNNKQVNHIIKDLGIKPGSEESKGLQWYAEKTKDTTAKDPKDIKAAAYDLADLKRDFPQSWQKIVEAEKIMREMYEDYYTLINNTLQKIYPEAALVNQVKQIREMTANQIEEKTAYLEKMKADPDRNANEIKRIERELKRLSKKYNNADYEVRKNKRLPHRTDYVHHFMEMEGGRSSLVQLGDEIRKVMGNEGHNNVSNQLSGISAFTKPNTKWAGFMQSRGTGSYKADAVGALMQYIPVAEHKAFMDMYTGYLRGVVAELRYSADEAKTDQTTMIRWLSNYTNDITGKTNPYDRFLENAFNGKGRQVMKVLRMINGRVKSNAVVGNVNSMLAQAYNLPNGVAVINEKGGKGAARDWKLGLKLYMADKFNSKRLVDQSVFLAERFMGNSIDDSYKRHGNGLIKDIVGNVEALTGFMLEFGDREVAHQIWYAAYAQGRRLGVDNVIQYADELTRRSIAGRGVGEVPIIQKSQIVGLIAPFQVEVNNQWQLCKHLVGEKAAGSLMLMILTTFLMNAIKKKVTGTDGVGLDPISDIIDAVQEGDPTKAGGYILGDVISNMPFGAQAMYMAGLDDDYTVQEFFGSNDPTRYGIGNIGISDLAKTGVQIASGKADEVDWTHMITNYGLPYGGKQAERIIKYGQDAGVLPRISRTEDEEGNTSTSFGRQAGAYNKSGKLKYAFDNNLGNTARGLAFGTYATDAGRQYLDEGWSAMGDTATSAYKQIMEQGASAGETYDAVRSASKLVKGEDYPSGVDNASSTAARKVYEDAGLWDEIEKGYAESEDPAKFLTGLKLNKTVMGWSSDEWQKQYDSMMAGMKGEASTFGMNAGQASAAEALADAGTDIATSKEVFDSLETANINGVKNSKAAVNRKSWEDSGITIDQIREIVESDDNTLEWSDFGLNKTVSEMTDEEYKAVITEANGEPAEAVAEAEEVETEEPKAETAKKTETTNARATSGSAGNVNKKVQTIISEQDLYDEIFNTSTAKKTSTRTARKKSGTTVKQQAAQIEKLYKAATSSNSKTASKVSAKLKTAVNDISDTDIALYNELVLNHKKLMKKLKQ